MHTQCICVFRVIPKKTMNPSLHNINRLILVMEMKCVYCEVGTKFLNEVRINFFLRRVKEEF
jgi:hypothetical protein